MAEALLGVGNGLHSRAPQLLALVGDRLLGCMPYLLGSELHSRVIIAAPGATAGQVATDTYPAPIVP